MKRLTIDDCRLTIEQPGRSLGDPNRKSKIENRKLILGAVTLLLACLPVTATPKPTPTQTPTPRPGRLSGGFGRGAPDAAATPPVAGDGQSLGETVRAAGEAKKRKESRPPISITNETLVTDPKEGRLTTASPRSEPTPAAVERAKQTPAPAEEAEAYWRERRHSARARVEELREHVRRFEQESKKLENDFYSWDDGQYRDGVIKPAWDKKREELETARRDLEQAEKELSELPEKARKAGALPGWLRE
jgi:exonuclease VII small subunit